MAGTASGGQVVTLIRKTHRDHRTIPSLVENTHFGALAFIFLGLRRRMPLVAAILTKRSITVSTVTPNTTARATEPEGSVRKTKDPDG